jgi:hypothetical protein
MRRTHDPYRHRGGLVVARTVGYEVVVDTSLYTPSQLQPRATLSLSFGALTWWLRTHLVSFPRLIGEKGYSVVILGGSTRYERSLGFFDADTLDVRATLSVLRGGTRLRLEVDVGAAGHGVAVRTSLLLCPVQVVERTSLAAEVVALSPELLSRFRPDEVSDASPKREVMDQLARVEGEGRLLGERRGTFIVHRHLCEIADQWWFAEIPRLTEPVRELLAHESSHRRVRRSLTEPLREFHFELTRPYFWWHEGEVHTQAYAVADRLAFVHRLVATSPIEEAHGTVVEWF